VRGGRVIFVLLALAAATACGGGSGASSSARPFRLVAPDGLRGVLRREREAASGSSTTTTAPPPTTTTRPPPPHPVAHVQETFVDHARTTPPRGGRPEQPNRTIVTTVYYPATAAPTDAAPSPPPLAGPFPLVVFAHGYEIDAGAYAPLLTDLAAGGYVVAAPDFPGTSTAHAGAAIRSDALQQPTDISFVITSMIDLSAAPGLLAGSVDPNAIGDSGHSDGGVTAAAAAYNTCCIDPRIKASTILTGGAFGFEGEWFPPGTPPVMFVHATADEINPYGASTSMFAQAQSPKYLFTIDGGSHLEVFVDPPWEENVARAMVAFYDLYLKGDQSAAPRLADAGSQPGYSLESG
jgi:predicted dienelactone hydrolase